jgi:spore coat protein U-like protein
MGTGSAAAVAIARRWLLNLTAAMVGVGSVAAAQSGVTKTATLRVSARVVADCAITAQPLAFGPYDPVEANRSQPLDGSTVLSLVCTQGTIAAVDLNNGQHAGAVGPTGGVRRMLGPGGAALSYDLYSDASRASRVGVGSAGFALPAAPSIAPRSLTLFGRVAPGQAVPAGTYVDEVIVTVRF